MIALYEHTSLESFQKVSQKQSVNICLSAERPKLINDIWKCFLTSLQPVNSNTGYANGETSEMYNKFWCFMIVSWGRKCEGRRKRGSRGRWWEPHVTVTFNVIGYEGVVWIYLALDVLGGLLWTHCHKILGCTGGGIFFTTWETVNFSRTKVLYDFVIKIFTNVKSF